MHTCEMNKILDRLLCMLVRSPYACEPCTTMHMDMMASGGEGAGRSDLHVKKCMHANHAPVDMSAQQFG